MKVLSVNDPEFKKYGTVLDGYDFTGLIGAMEQSPVPDDVIYEPSVDYLEELPIAKEFEKKAYGELPIQIGFAMVIIICLMLLSITEALSLILLLLMQFLFSEFCRMLRLIIHMILRRWKHFLFLPEPV